MELMGLLCSRSYSPCLSLPMHTASSTNRAQLRHQVCYTRRARTWKTLAPSWTKASAP